MPPHAPSYYAATANQTLSFPPLEGEIQTDVCVVGGGFSGLNTALELAERGARVVLLEARRIGWGASGRNGGQLIRGVGHDVEQFESVIGAEGVRELKRLGFEAVDLVRQRIARHDIQCDLHWGFADLANKPRHWQHLQEEQTALQALGYPHPLRLVPKDQLAEVVGSQRYEGALVDEGSGHLHPLNLALGEAAAAQALGVQLFEDSQVTRLEYGPKVRVHTARGRVSADTLVLCCNAYINELQPDLAAQVLPAGSYVIATEPLSAERAARLLPGNRAVCDQNVAVDYFRLSADRRLLFGGACHYSGRDPKDIAGYMRPKMLEVFPELADVRVDYAWGGMIGIGANRLPQIGRLREHPNVFHAQAYAGHGVNATHLAGHLLAEAILAQSAGFDLFAQVPHARFPGGRHLRSPLLALGMLWYRLKDSL